MAIVKNSMKFFTGVGTQVGQRISILSDILSTREEPPRIWYNQYLQTTTRLSDQLQINVLEVQEHLETYFDRKENVMEVNKENRFLPHVFHAIIFNDIFACKQCLEAMKTTTKLSLFSDTESAHDGSTNAALGSPDPATSEILMDLARGLYKLIFQLLLLIDSDHKMAISIMNNMRHNDQMKDLSTTYLDVRGALLRCIDDADMDSLDTSTSTEGEHTPTQIAAPASVPTQDFENTLYDLIDKNKWNAALHLTRQFRKYSSTATLSPTSNFALQPSTSSTSCISSSSFNYGCMPIASDNNWMLDDTSIILLVYAQKLVKDRNGTFSSDVTNICCSSVANFYLFFFCYI